MDCSDEAPGPNALIRYPNTTQGWTSSDSEGLTAVSVLACQPCPVPNDCVVTRKADNVCHRGKAK